MSTSASLSTENIEEIYHTACEMHRTGRYLEAQEHYLRLLEFFPYSSSLHYNIGLLLYEQGNYRESLDHYLQALETSEDDPDLLYNLGLCLKKCGKVEEAILVYAGLTEIQPDDIDCLYNLACCYIDAHTHDKASEILRQILHLNPEFQSALNNLAYILHLQGKLSEARIYYHRLLELNPDHQAARHMLASLQGEKVSNAPAEYIRTVFNSYAQNFDKNLVQDLGYWVPEQLRSFINKQAGVGIDFPFQRALDLGCGTGLSGAAFADICNHLTGIDISEEMVEQARKKGIYDRLVIDEITSFLNAETGISYDFVMMADVLIYIGDMQPVLTALQARTTANALVCFSTETTEEEGDYVLQPTGRFAHSPAYVKTVAENTGWFVRSLSSIEMRKENEKWISGSLFFLHKIA